MTFFKVTALSAALALGAVGSALAQETQEDAALRQYCTGDYMRHCSMFDPDSPQVEQCFKAKMKELSPECRATIAAYTKKNPKGRRQ